MDFMWVFRILVHCAALKSASTILVKLTARAGENLTLWSGLNSSIHATLCCGDEVLLNCDQGIIFTIKDNITADLDNGPIVMLNVQTEDNKDYTLQIINSQSEVANYIIRLNVTAQQRLDDLQTTHPPSPPENGRYLAACISVGVIIVLILVLLAFWKRNRILENINSVI